MNNLNATSTESNGHPDLIRGLRHPEAYAHPADGTTVLETHISWIVLAGSYAYKIKKPLHLDFLDFSTLERRHYFCQQELLLNRRFAPGLYIDVVPIGGSPTKPRIGAEPAIEWAVQMHRFAADAGLDRQLAERRVTGDDMRQLAETVARFHEGAEIMTDPASGTFESVRGPALDNFDSLAVSCRDTVLAPTIESLRRWTEQSTETLCEQFERRRTQQRVRDCHGDLHLANIVRLGPETGCVPFDCLEFDPALRRIDVISDIAFLHMDLLRCERADLAHVFLNRYLEVTGDYTGLAVLRYYTVYRAVVRAKTTMIKMAQSGAPDDDSAIREFLDLALRVAGLAGEAVAPLLIVCHGLSGSGKTWLSDRLVPALPALRLRSDVVRKQLHGLPELARSDAGLHTGLYSDTVGRQTYARLAEHAACALSAGLDVIVDATCLRRADRAAFEAVANTIGASFVILHCRASRPVLEQRIRQRNATGSDASEADLAVLADQHSKVEPLSAAELGHALAIDTAAIADTRAIAVELRARARPHPT